MEKLTRINMLGDLPVEGYTKRSREAVLWHMVIPDDLIRRCYSIKTC